MIKNAVVAGWWGRTLCALTGFFFY